jgi:hypothetical protein
MVEVCDSHGAFDIFLRYIIKMANLIDNLHAVFAMCGITDEATCMNIINVVSKVQTLG